MYEDLLSVNIIWSKSMNMVAWNINNHLGKLGLLEIFVKSQWQSLGKLSNWNKVWSMFLAHGIYFFHKWRMKPFEQSYMTDKCQMEEY